MRWQLKTAKPPATSNYQLLILIFGVSVLGKVNNSQHLYPCNSLHYAANYGGHFFTGRITQSLISVIQKLRIDHEPFPTPQDPFSKAFLFDALELALTQKLPYLPVVASGNIEADAVVKGYSEPMVVLISPECISGCDIIADLIKKSGRAKLIGTHSNGTGAGVFGDQIRHQALWEDPYEFVRVKISTYLFGVFLGPVNEPIHDFDAHKDKITENSPTVADVIYDTDLSDLTLNGKGWASRALQELFGQPQPPMP